MRNLFRRKKHVFPDLSAAFIRGMEQEEQRDYTIQDDSGYVIQELGKYTGQCFTEACKEIQSHHHGSQCHFTCICEKGQTCHDNGT